MLNILSAILGPHRAVSVYAFARTKGLALAGGLALICIVAALLLLNDDGKHEHEAFMTVDVLSATPINGDAKNGIIASVRLPDGTATSITSTEAPIAQSVATSACVEKRVYVESGEAVIGSSCRAIAKTADTAQPLGCHRPETSPGDSAIYSIWNRIPATMAPADAQPQIGRENPWPDQ